MSLPHHCIHVCNIRALFVCNIDPNDLAPHYSMGGHGALICAMKNPGMFKSASAFAPICNPIKAPWGVKAFSGYLGTDQEKWKVGAACGILH